MANVAAPDLIVTITDARKCFCTRGIKSWFDGHGLDFRAFLANGIAAGELPVDAFAERVIARALERSDGR